MALHALTCKSCRKRFYTYSFNSLTVKYMQCLDLFSVPKINTQTASIAKSVIIHKHNHFLDRSLSVYCENE